MLGTFNDSNIFNRLVLSFMYRNNELKNMALRYVTNMRSNQNYKVIFESDEWKKFAAKKELLAKEIVDEVNAMNEYLDGLNAYSDEENAYLDEENLYLYDE
jgi:hypothetical protein